MNNLFSGLIGEVKPKSAYKKAKRIPKLRAIEDWGNILSFLQACVKTTQAEKQKLGTPGGEACKQLYGVWAMEANDKVKSVTQIKEAFFKFNKKETIRNCVI